MVPIHSKQQLDPCVHYASVFGHKCARCCYVSPHLRMGLQHIPCTKNISQTISPTNSVTSNNDCVVCVSDERDMDTKEGN